MSLSETLLSVLDGLMTITYCLRTILVLVGMCGQWNSDDVLGNINNM
jgi:hypothetical protein